MSPRLLVEIVTGFFLENLDEGGQVGLAGKGRVREVGSFNQGINHTDEWCDPVRFSAKEYDYLEKQDARSQETRKRIDCNSSGRK